MLQETITRCSHCGIPIRWTPLEVRGMQYCWEGCAKGEPVPRLKLDRDPAGRDERFIARV